MSTQVSHILQLTDALAAHLGLTHWAISMRLTGKGDFLDRLKKGADVRTRTAEKILTELSRSWPDDLEWVPGIPRPETGGAS